jgi:peptide/nickel transport system permease protein
VGIAAALIIAFIGVNVGMISGYFGKSIDLFLMRIVDILYGLPFLPLMIVLLSLWGRSRVAIILCIGLIAWRDVSRIIRAQVLTIRELPYIQSARVMGAGHFRIIYFHILPNVFPSVVLFLSFAFVWSILAHADISFLGFGDPATLTWGSMIYHAWSVGVVTSAFWWYLPPAICIAMVSSGAFFFARAFEESANPRLKDRY